MSEQYYKMSKRELDSRKNSSYKNVRNAKSPTLLDNGSKIRLSPVFYFVLIIFCLLLLSALISALRGVNQSITFTGFLNYLSSSPSLDFVSMSDFSIAGDWGLVDFLRVFLNVISVLFTIVVWFCQIAINLFEWLFWIIRFFFI